MICSESSRGYQDSWHSFVSGWSAQNRTGLFHQDRDGDGKQEVANAVNGTWNHASVSSQGGVFLHNAQFGPRRSKILRVRMRDMDVAGLNAEGKKEILVGLSEWWVVCLSHACEKVWSARLPSPPLSPKRVGRPP